MGIVPKWDSTGQAYVLDNGSKVYIFGVKAQDQLARYSKIRGLTLAGIYNDQTEELPNAKANPNGFVPHGIMATMLLCCGRSMCAIRFSRFDESSRCNRRACQMPVFGGPRIPAVL